MKLLTARTMRNTTKALVAAFVSVLMVSINTSPAQAFAGTLENGNMAYAQSSFSTGEACNYLPGFEKGYDAWHFVLTTRGATFQQDPKNPAVAINLNFVFMRQDGSLFVIKSGAWVQTGKGAYTYTPVADRIRMVQAGTLAQINGSDSGMRLSHTCPGTGSITPTTTPSPTPSSTPTPSASASASPTTSTSPTPSASASPSPSATPTATPKPSSTMIPTLAPRPSARASAIQIRPTTKPNALPTPTPTPQGIQSSPTPTPTPTPTATKSSTPTPTASPSASPTPTEPNNPAPPFVPTPPPVEDPKKVEFVEPKTPANIDPKSFPEPPSSPVVITEKPVYGEVKANNDGTFTYTPPAVIPELPVVDVVEFKYTNLAGQAVIVRKEFVLTVKGDVPSIIQTGGDTAPSSNNFGLVTFVLTAALIFVRRLIATKRGHTHA